MASDNMSRVLDILRSLYPHVQTLEEFANSIVFREGQRPALIEQSDSNRFRNFVREVFICTDKPLQQVPSCNQICTLPELLAFVLNSLKRKRQRNVLTHGYGFLGREEERNADQLKFQGGVTQSAAYIHGSDMWKKASGRLGTDATRYLLESCSVFVAAPPSCAFQACGVPVYDRVSTTTTTGSSGFRLLRRPGRDAGGIHHGSRQGGSAATRKGRGGPWTAVSTAADGRGDEKNGNACGRKGKRRREADLMAGGQGMLRSGKRRRMAADDPTEGSHRVCGETQGEQTMAAESSTSPRPSEESGPDSKRPVEVPTTSGTLPLDAGSGRRAGLPPPPPAPSSQRFIRALGMLYGGRGMRGFLLNRKRKGDAAAPRRLQGRDLVSMVFFEGTAYLNGATGKPKKLPRRFFSMVPLFERLLRLHRRCPYSRILQSVCPAGLPGDGGGRGDVRSLLPQHSAPARVCLFVRRCLSLVVPQELWGSDHNRLNFLARVRGFLRSGKFERLSSAELMWKMKVNDCDWLKISKTGHCPPSELSYRTRLLSKVLAWLLDGYVLGLVRACFYTTETMGQKNALRFYRRQVWAKLQELAFRDHLSKGQMEELSAAQVASLPRPPVAMRLRLIPKADGMRPITRVTGVGAKTRLFQARVRDLLDVLRVCVRSTPPLLGATVWGLTDIHRVLSSLAPPQKLMPKPLYFVKADVSGAYESLPHAKLLEVIGRVLSPVQEKVFTVRMYAKIWADSHEGLKKTFVRQADFLEGNMGSTNMKGFVMSLQREGKVHDAILVEQHYSSDIRGRDVLEFFRQMLTGSIVQIGKRTFRQCRGIPQGSVVSSLLCCLCYGHMENVLFKHTSESGGCLMRLVDDFLFITPHLHQAQTFLKTLFGGVPEYGLVVNPQKVAVNFPLSGQGCHPGIRVLPACSLFPWCGLLLDTHTLDVYNDYSSYAGLSLRYSLTLGSSHSAGQQMKRKLLGVLRLKCHAVFLDLKTNSLEAVYKNLYKLVLLHAYRFHVCAQSLPFGQKVAKNPAYFLQMIWDMVRYTNHLVRLSNKGVSLGSKSQTGVLQQEAVELLFCSSFLLVLSRHRLLYAPLLPALHKRKRRLEGRLGDLRLARVRQAAAPEDLRAVRT